MVQVAPERFITPSLLMSDTTMSLSKSLKWQELLRRASRDIDESEHFAVETCTVLEPFGVYLRIDEEATPTIFRICLLDS